MPRLIVTEGASHGLERCRQFLANKNAPALLRAGEAIAQNFAQLETTPEMGRPWSDVPELRELITACGDSGYIALYRHKPDDDAVYVLAFRHQKEAGY